MGKENADSGLETLTGVHMWDGEILKATLFGLRSSSAWERKTLTEVYSLTQERAERRKRRGQEKKKEKEEGWKSANETENPHTEVYGKKNADTCAYLGWCKSEGNTCWA